MVKQVKTASELDRISNLPDPIISHILSFLPTKTAVRTSILSSRWKYHYVSSISTLDFRNCLRDVPRKNWSNFNSFVDRLFFYSKQASLECFKVNSYSWDADYQRLYGWLCAAMWHGRGIKEIEIFSLDKNVLILPSLLFTCHSLVSLKLEVSLCEMNVPANVCLPNLKILHLERFEFPDGHSILKLISTCHALEDLDFIECKFHNIIELNIHSLSLKRLVLDFDYPVWKGGRHYDYSIVINAPSLVYFRYFDLLVKGFALSDMKCLEEADVKILQYSGREDELSAARHLLQRIGNVKSLRFFVDDFEELFRTCVNSVFAFHNLIELEFHEYSGYWRGRWLLEFLHRVPNLKILKLNFYPPNEGIRSISNEVPCPSCLLFHLKEIKMSNFVDEQPMLELVGYFLKHGLVLENLIIDTAGELSTEEMILSFHRESKKCKARIV